MSNIKYKVVSVEKEIPQLVQTIYSKTTEHSNNVNRNIKK